MVGSLKAFCSSTDAALVGLPRVNMHADPINKIKTTLKHYSILLLHQDNDYPRIIVMKGHRKVSGTSRKAVEVGMDGGLVWARKEREGREPAGGGGGVSVKMWRGQWGWAGAFGAQLIRRYYFLD